MKAVPLFSTPLAHKKPMRRRTAITQFEEASLGGISINWRFANCC